MKIIVRQFNSDDIEQMNCIWNEVVEEGAAFPQIDFLDSETGRQFFESQSYCGVAQSLTDNKILGLYILHPNNVGRCSHICNASYAVAFEARGQHIGEKMVRDSIKQGKKAGYKILQFNAVVKTNTAARKLYEKLGFTSLGTIPNGFLCKNGKYIDIVPYYYEFK